MGRKGGEERPRKGRSEKRPGEEEQQAHPTGKACSGGGMSSVLKHQVWETGQLCRGWAQVGRPPERVSGLSDITEDSTLSPGGPSTVARPWHSHTASSRLCVSGLCRPPGDLHLKVWL